MAVSACSFPLYLLDILQREQRKYKINFQQNHTSSMNHYRNEAGIERSKWKIDSAKVTGDN